VFGLGNKTYEQYNETGKYVDKRLEELGATRIFELGLGDDDAKYTSSYYCSTSQISFYCIGNMTVPSPLSLD